MHCVPSLLCRVRHSAKPLPSVFKALAAIPIVSVALGCLVASHLIHSWIHYCVSMLVFMEYMDLTISHLLGKGI
jgi:hypothetical protein